MKNKTSTNPRSIRAREAFYNSIISLLRKKTFSKITVTEISKNAGFARHTFYGHFESKEDLLNKVIYSILDDIFQDVVDSNMGKGQTPQERGEIFFKVWLDHRETVKILNTVDVDCLLINSFTTYLEKYKNNYLINLDFIGIDDDKMPYFINYIAYSFVGILKQWFKDGMKYPPEVMSETMNHFTKLRALTLEELISLSE